MASVTILHGEQVVSSRNALQDLRQSALDASSELQTIAAKDLDEAKLHELLGEQSLFATPRTVIIEELHSLPRSKKKNNLITLLTDFAASDDDQLSLILWEKRDLTKTMLKKFPDAKVTQYKASKYIFSFVESLSPKKDTAKQLSLLHKAVEADSAFFVFTMIARQIRMLLQISDGSRPKGPPFVINKLEQQARGFSQKQLLSAHANLHQIDLRMKQSLSPLELEEALDLFVINL